LLAVWGVRLVERKPPRAPGDAGKGGGGAPVISPCQRGGGICGSFFLLAPKRGGGLGPPISGPGDSGNKNFGVSGASRGGEKNPGGAQRENKGGGGSRGPARGKGFRDYGGPAGKFLDPQTKGAGDPFFSHNYPAGGKLWGPGTHPKQGLTFFLSFSLTVKGLGPINKITTECVLYQGLLGDGRGGAVFRTGGKTGGGHSRVSGPRQKRGFIGGIRAVAKKTDTKTMPPGPGGEKCRGRGKKTVCNQEGRGPPRAGRGAFGFMRSFPQIGKLDRGGGAQTTTPPQGFGAPELGKGGRRRPEKKAVLDYLNRSGWERGGGPGWGPGFTILRNQGQYPKA